MDPILKEALRLQELGFAVHWLLPKTKRPVAEGWATAPVMTTAELSATYQPGYNVGFRPGKYSVVDGKEVCVLDIDVRGGERYAQEAYTAARTLIGDLPADVISGSGTGRHIYLGFPVGQSPDKAATTLRKSDIWLLDGKLCAHGTKGARQAWVVELLSTGKNVVLPPSIHPDTGRPYTFA